MITGKTNVAEFDLVDESQPHHGREPNLMPSRYTSGSKRAVMALKRESFDPIAELVSTYRTLQLELKIQEDLRDGRIVQLRVDGKPKAYYADAHYSLFDKLISVSDKLLRYNYGRVPENVDDIENRSRSPLVINLAVPGQPFVINQDVEDIDEIKE